MTKTTNKYLLHNEEFSLVEDKKEGVNASLSSSLLAESLPRLDDLDVLDLGCGSGFMTITAFKHGANSVTGIDLCDTEEYLRESVKVNGFDPTKLKFEIGNLFDQYSGEKADIIIANLPQHAMPPTKAAKILSGKYGGADGSDLVVKAITEGVQFLNEGGRYFGAISELTNHKRTMTLAKIFYNTKVLCTVEKQLRKGEMLPYVTNEELRDHLYKLRELGLINFREESGEIYYDVHFCELTKKDK